ncbi:rod shape-determining protein MreD [Nonomuraea sp. NPDC050310]|uniref:rod shape-determining protein MreD n=1 Tax=unclassified Nonomuraea TaxID=2593643 RepID=UPI003401E656
MIAALALVAALLVQMTLVNRLHLPAGGVPDLVLLTVIGLASTRGPVAGAVMGFCAGLLADLMPPAAHLVGQYAFVYALIGFLAGRGVGGPVTTVVLCVVLAPVLAAAVGGLIGDSRVTMATLTEMVPVTMVYTLILAPVVVWTISWSGRGRLAT